MTRLKKVLKAILPESAYQQIKGWNRGLRQRIFMSQGTIIITYGRFQLVFPKNHLILSFLDSQPYRDLNLAMAAKFLGEKYPDDQIVDIGANVGDTAALMATQVNNPLVLIEASDYYFGLLQKNSALFPNKVSLHNVLIGDGGDRRGVLNHWGGTASFCADEQSETMVPSARLEDIVDEHVCLVKSDTDGHDFAILNASLLWLEKVKPALFFENQIRTEEDLLAADALFENLFRIGYRHFFIWDDPGYHLLSTTVLDELKQLNRYQYKVWQGKWRKSISNFDVLCLQAKDTDISEQVAKWCGET